MVGTPGRICALLQKGDLVTPSLGLLVLDEADKLMSDTFLDDVFWLHSVLPSKKQVCLSSLNTTPSLWCLLKFCTSAYQLRQLWEHYAAPFQTFVIAGHCHLRELH